MFTIVTNVYDCKMLCAILFSNGSFLCSFWPVANKSSSAASRAAPAKGRSNTNDKGMMKKGAALLGCTVAVCRSSTELGSVPLGVGLPLQEALQRCRADPPQGLYVHVCVSISTCVCVCASISMCVWVGMLACI